KTGARSGSPSTRPIPSWAITRSTSMAWTVTVTVPSAAPRRRPTRPLRASSTAWTATATASWTARSWPTGPADPVSEPGGALPQRVRHRGYPRGRAEQVPPEQGRQHGVVGKHAVDTVERVSRHGILAPAPARPALQAVGRIPSVAG